MSRARGERRTNSGYRGRRFAQGLLLPDCRLGYRPLTPAFAIHSPVQPSAAEKTKEAISDVLGCSSIASANMGTFTRTIVHAQKRSTRLNREVFVGWDFPQYTKRTQSTPKTQAM